MKIEFYILDVDGEYPLRVIKEKIRLDEIWSGEYHQGPYHPRRTIVDPTIKVKHNSGMERMKQWRIRKEDFGALIYDRITRMVFKADEEALRLVECIQKGLSLDEASRDLRIDIAKIKECINRVGELYNLVSA